jgi:hypothetical protein
MDLIHTNAMLRCGYSHFLAIWLILLLLLFDNLLTSNRMELVGATWCY